jgi:tRNA 2-thiouridine synthesizing protein A
MTIHAYDVMLDVEDLRCPMPLLKTKQAISSLSLGQVIKVVTKDSGSWRDIPAFVDLSTHTLLEKQKINDQFIFFIAKGE